MQQKIRIGKLYGILHKSKAKNPPGIVMVHGFGGEGTKKGFEYVAEKLCDNGYAVLRFLFDGYKNGDLINLTISKEIPELKSAIDFLELQGINKEKIGIVAQSLGCAVSILLNDPRIKAMVLLAPPVYLKKWFVRQFGEDLIKQLETNGNILLGKHGKKRRLGVGFWNDVKLIEKLSKEQIRKISCPLFIVHNRHDKIIPFGESEFIFNAANSPKELKVIESSGHSIIMDPKFAQGITGFICDFFGKYFG